MKVFVINLKSQKNRLDFMTEQLRKFDIEFERVDAVVGNDLSNEEIKSTNSRFLQWCRRGYVLRGGEMGCAMSHMKVWQRIVDENISHACVLEDDVTVLPEITKTLTLIDGIDDHDKCCAYQISMNEKEGGTVVVDSGIYGVNDAQHMCGYILNSKAARFLLTCNKPLATVCDDWARWIYFGLKVYKVVPRSVAHWNRNVLGSMNDNEGHRKSTNVFLWKIKRGIGKPIDFVYKYIAKQRIKHFISKL